MNRTTPVYTPFTDGDDGSYIVDNFVSREVLPSMREEYDTWKYTYATLGYILKSCEINHPLDNLGAVNELLSGIEAMIAKWKSAINVFGSSTATLMINELYFLSMRQKGQDAMLLDKKKLTFNHFLNMHGAKLLYQVLDDESILLGKRIALVKTIIDITDQSFECNFDPNVFAS